MFDHDRLTLTPVKPAARSDMRDASQSTPHRIGSRLCGVYAGRPRRVWNVYGGL
jgi:hypothetical protein